MHMLQAPQKFALVFFFFWQPLCGKDRTDQMLVSTICMDCCSGRLIKKTTKALKAAWAKIREIVRIGDMMDHIYLTRSSRGWSSRLKYSDSRGTRGPTASSFEHPLEHPRMARCLRKWTSWKVLARTAFLNEHLGNLGH